MCNAWHRGGSRLAPENTLAAFRNALTLPIDAIELDVHMSRDGHAVVFHDNTVDGRTNGHGNILDLDFAYLRSLNAAAHFPGGWPESQQIPALREVLDLAKGKVQVYIEIKASKRDGVPGRYPHIAESVIEQVRAVGMLDQVLIISFDWFVLPLVKSLEPALQTGALVSNDVWGIANFLPMICQPPRMSMTSSWGSGRSTRSTKCGALPLPALTLLPAIDQTCSQPSQYSNSIIRLLAYPF